MINNGKEPDVRYKKQLSRIPEKIQTGELRIWIMWNFHGSLFLALEFLRDLGNANVWNIHGLSFVLSGITRDKVNEWKILGQFSQKYILLTIFYGMKISDKIEIRHFFQSRIFFHLSSNLHRSWLSAFKWEANFSWKNIKSVCFTYFFCECSMYNPYEFE